MEIFRATFKESLSPKTNPLKEQYPTDLNMYTDIPKEQINIEKFQELAVERVKLLKIFETVNIKNSKELPYKEQIIDEALKQNLKYFMPLVRGHVDYESRRLDHLSHFILRLFYCRSEEYRKWFMAREVEFFRLKFSNTDKKEDVMLFMNRNDLHYTPISDDEKLTLAKDLHSSTAKNITLETTNIYKVPFVQVIDLIRNRKVFVKKGFAYVPHQDLSSVLCSIFRTRLSHALTICVSNISVLENDERMRRILKGLHNSSSDNDYYVKVKNNIPISALDSLSLKSFPLCMRHMHDTFKRTHHLRHMARLQYGLFLKGIGVSLEDSLKFWREGFTQKEGIDVDKFEKTYSYSIRHNYGKEGKRANYTPHNCVKIIMENVAPGDNHGCPFKHSDLNHLKQRLLSYNLNISEVAEVINYVNNGHYQLACTKFFEITHNVSNVKGITHPNAYFEESQKLLSAKMNPNKSTDDVEPMTVE